MSEAGLVGFVRNPTGTVSTEVFRLSCYLCIGTHNIAEAHGCPLALITACDIAITNAITKGGSKAIVGCMFGVGTGKFNLDQRLVHIAKS